MISMIGGICIECDVDNSNVSGGGGGGLTSPTKLLPINPEMLAIGIACNDTPFMAVTKTS